MLFFSAKESAYKAQYPLTGKFLGFHALSIDLDLEVGAWRATFREPAGEFAIGDRIDGRWRRSDGLIATTAWFPTQARLFETADN